MSRADDIRELLCSDNPDDHQRARQLAQGRDELLEVLNAQDKFMASIALWKTEARAPEALRERILAPIRADEAARTGPARGAAVGREARPRLKWNLVSWQGALAAAATMVVVLFAARAATFAPVVVSTSGRLVVADALAAAHDAEQRHAAAIAELQRAAEPILNRANDPRTSGAEAALLLAYRDRLSAIDTAIAEVNSYLDDNPGLASARTVLLAAYIDKTRILEEILGRNERGELG